MPRGIPIFKNFWGPIMKSDKTSHHGAREGFEAFDPAQVGGLSDAQRDAIARMVVAQGPALVRQANTQRMLAKVAFGSSLAAAAALVFMLRSREPETQPAVAAMAVGAACGADAAPTPITHEGHDSSTIEIGSDIVAIAPRDTQVSIVQAAPCVTQLALRDGTLTVRARNLRGGSVLVDTLHGQIRAEGAFMRIATLASSTSVSVVEGEVVMRSAAGAEKVVAGRSIKVNREGVERAALSEQERKNVLGAFDAPAEASAQPAEDTGTKTTVAVRNPRLRPTQPSPQKVKPEPEPTLSATDLLAQADALWRKGDYAASRQAFRTAAKDPGTIGEAAWVRLARLELSAGSSEQALSALKARKSRGGKGTLGAEALWLEAQALERMGRSAEARATAQTLLRDYPTSPQAAAAKRLVAKSDAP